MKITDKREKSQFMENKKKIQQIEAAIDDYHTIYY